MPSDRTYIKSTHSSLINAITTNCLVYKTRIFNATLTTIWPHNIKNVIGIIIRSLRLKFRLEIFNTNPKNVKFGVLSKNADPYLKIKTNKQNVQLFYKKSVLQRSNERLEFARQLIIWHTYVKRQVKIRHSGVIRSQHGLPVCNCRQTSVAIKNCIWKGIVNIVAHSWHDIVAIIFFNFPLPGFFLLKIIIVTTRRSVWKHNFHLNP